MGSLSWWHWVIIIAALVLIFGAKKLPDAARGIGRSMRILKSEVSAMHDDDAAQAAAGTASATATQFAAPGQITAPAVPPQIAQPTPVAVAAPMVAAPVPQPVAAPAASAPSVVATTIDGKPAVIINGVPTLIDRQAT